MKKNSTKHTIYFRFFSVFFLIYLVLMAGFSAFLLSKEKKEAGLELNAFGYQINQTVGDVLKDNTDNNNKITDIRKVKKALVNKATFFTYLDTEAAIFTSDYKLIYNTNDNWLCCYTAYMEGNTSYAGYGLLNPNDWFSKKEVAEIKKYLNTNPKAKKVGDLTGYSVLLNSFWVDNEIIIPDKINISTNYASSFDERGHVTSSYGTNKNDIVYTSGYKNTKGLPYYQYGSIQPSNSNYNDSETRKGLRNMVLDKDRLKKAVANMQNISYERAGLLNYHCYLLKPYHNTMKITEDKNNYSEFWTVIAENVNLWHRCAGTLIFVWASCFITFFAAAAILSRQTYKTYKKREELEKQRQETTNAIAHDLKTPLSIISGYAQYLMENIHTEKREYYASSIHANINRMDKIIREMLELSRLETNLCAIKFEDVCLGEIGAEVLKRYLQICHEKSVITYLEGDAIAHVDHSLIERVIDNFFVNALDNTPEGGTIGIKIIDNTFEIYNSGSHIPEDKLNEIWLPYKKADASRSNTKGTGLGLAISRNILELYKFSYGAKNTDEGVLFWFKFN